MDSQLIADGTVDFSGGQDASRIADKVASNSFYAGVNLSTFQGDLRPRFAFEEIALSFPDRSLVLKNKQSRSYQAIFESGKFQMASPYAIGSENYLVVVISGVIYSINTRTHKVKILDITDGTRLNENLQRLNSSNAGRYLVIFDFPAFPVIIDGFTARRADPAKFEVPISVLGAYNQNRLFIANAGQGFTAGDPTGNLVTPEAPITFTEIEQASSPFVGQIFELPTGITGPITGMTFLPLTDTSTGIGPLLVSSANSIYSCNSQQPRTQWEAGQFSSAFVTKSGFAGPRAFVTVNSDVFYISSDGQIRSVSMSRAEQGKWSKVPLSKEVKNWLQYWDLGLVKYGAMGYFANKIFATANPFRTDALSSDGRKVRDIAHGGFVVIAMDNISTLTSEAPLAWEGLWIPCRPMDIVTLNETRSFVIGKSYGKNTIFEINPDSSCDIVRGRRRLIESTVYTKEHVFQDPFQNKEIHSIDFTLRQVRGDFKIGIDFKPSHSDTFTKWRDQTQPVASETCSYPKPNQINGFGSLSFREYNIGAPQLPDSCPEGGNPLTGELWKVFRKIQMRFKIRGLDWRIDAYKIKAKVLVQNELNSICTAYPEADIPVECNHDWDIPEDTNCLQSP